MGDVAASGGYYIAAPADTIVAEPGTITGSIGVIGGKYSFKGLYEKLGIHKEILKRGEHADFYTDYGDYPLTEKAIVQKQIQEIYDDFIEKVALGRTGLTVEDVDRLGRGRIWSGRQAKENGLVDELGGLSLAIAIARERAGLGEKSVEIVEFPKKTWMSELLNTLGFPFVSLWEGFVTPNSFENSDMEDRGVGTKSRLQFITQYGGLSTTARLLNIVRKHRLFLLMPYHITVGN
ncbi:Serine protease SPPA, chloroplastic [Geodia barretti]|uniref:Serine protease SPPA, chloroplastic n=1 Tax=Geodia barretti TaxID=519541 RepID=A0AA35R4G2_GEOBA|nr:Serine protease SPPA, chloroplastic [Geodia barretti]